MYYVYVAAVYVSQDDFAKYKNSNDLMKKDTAVLNVSTECCNVVTVAQK